MGTCFVDIGRIGQEKQFIYCYSINPRHDRGLYLVIYGAGPRTVRESNAKRSDEHVQLEDLRRATKVVARTLLDLLG